MEEQKTSADYQRAFRERTRAAGYVKRDVWVPPEQSEALRRLRAGVAQGHRSDHRQAQEGGMGNTTNSFVWTTETRCWRP